MKAHFYPFTGPVTPVPLDVLQALGVPATTVAEMTRIGTEPSTVSTRKGGRRG